MREDEVEEGEVELHTREVEQQKLKRLQGLLEQDLGYRSQAISTVGVF